jgi:hypothetical protein
MQIDHCVSFTFEGQDIRRKDVGVFHDLHFALFYDKVQSLFMIKPHFLEPLCTTFAVN